MNSPDLPSQDGPAESVVELKRSPVPRIGFDEDAPETAEAVEPDEAAATVATEEPADEPTEVPAETAAELPALIAEIRDGYAFDGPALHFGAAVLDGEAFAAAPVRIPLSMMNRHGLVAGATGTGKTKTLQLMAE